MCPENRGFVFERIVQSLPAHKFRNLRWHSQSGELPSWESPTLNLEDTDRVTYLDQSPVEDTPKLVDMVRCFHFLEPDANAIQAQIISHRGDAMRFHACPDRRSKRQRVPGIVA